MPLDKISKKKNILDANYQRYLNYFNIVAISLISSLFTIFWSYATKTISLDVLYFGSLMTTFIFGTFLFLIYQKANKAIKSIEEI